MNTETGIYGDYEIAGKMLEEHEKRDQQNSLEVKFENKIIFIFKMFYENVREAVDL